LAVGSDGGVDVLTNLGPGGFSAPVPNLGGSFSTALLALDMDGDRAVDLVRPDSSGHLLVLFNRGDGAFEEVATIESPGTSTFHQVVAVDLDGDDRPDLAFSAGVQGLLIARNAGKRKFQPAVDSAAGKWIEELA